MRHGRGKSERQLSDEPTYKIVRFRFRGDNEVIHTGLTLQEAQAWCEREDTHDMDAADPWFDGYEQE